ncbi:MAG: hypothetical protein E6K54_06800 [Gammaproteobacteria bacterium]|nr:MAG: hypothetical protein E6K54_06800 [Gammaproteobacteria bacterium]
MKDNYYAYAIDLSLRKGKDGQYSEPLIFECQPFLSSNLGGNSRWSYKNALKKAFPNSNITINAQGEIVNVYAKNPVQRAASFFELFDLKKRLDLPMIFVYASHLNHHCLIEVSFFTSIT